MTSRPYVRRARPTCYSTSDTGKTPSGTVTLWRSIEGPSRAEGAHKHQFPGMRIKPDSGRDTSQGAVRRRAFGSVTRLMTCALTGGSQFRLRRKVTARCGKRMLRSHHAAVRTGRALAKNQTF